MKNVLQKREENTFYMAEVKHTVIEYGKKYCHYPFVIVGLIMEINIYCTFAHWLV